MIPAPPLASVERGAAAAPRRARLEQTCRAELCPRALALNLAQDLSRRAARLAEAAPKLRAKGKEKALEALLDEDAVAAATPIAGRNDRARRRLFERLVTLGAPREFGGGSTGKFRVT